MRVSLDAARRYMLAQLRRPRYAPGGVVPTTNPQAIPPASAAYGLAQIIPPGWSAHIDTRPLLLPGESVVPLGGAGVSVPPYVAEEVMRAAYLDGPMDGRQPGDPPAGSCLIHGRWDCRTCWSTH